MAIVDADRAMIHADAMRAAQVAIERAGLAEHWNNLSLIIGHTRTALSRAEQRNVELDLAMREQSRLLSAAQDAHKAANRRIAELEASCDGWHRRACSHADAAHDAEQRLATAERERDEARVDAERYRWLKRRQFWMTEAQDPRVICMHPIASLNRDIDEAVDLYRKAQP